MKIKYVQEEDLLKIRTNLDSISEWVLKKNNSSIEKIILSEDIVKETEYSINDFDLVMNQPKEKSYLTDMDNIQIVYKNMKCLSDSQASDERIWVAYSFFEFKDYMQYRWGIEPDDLHNRYIYGYSKQRSLFRNGISRLWWIGRVTYDESRNDPFELTRFLCQYQDMIETICGRNVFNNGKLCLATLSALYDYYNEGNKITRPLILEIGKYSNLLAATYLVDMLTKEEMYNKVMTKIEKLIKEMENEM